MSHAKPIFPAGSSTHIARERAKELIAIHRASKGPAANDDHEVAAVVHARKVLVAFAIASTVCAAACLPKPDVYKPKLRKYDFPVKEQVDTDRSSDGSLFVGRGLSLFSDVRAFRPGDIITVRIEESAKASRNAETELNKENSDTSGFDLFGFVKALQKGNPNFDAKKLWESASQHKFQGSGRTARNDQFQTTLAAVVKRVLPRGLLFVEANKTILVNNEQHHYYISGVVRPMDIEPDNSVRSTLMADAQIEFTGKGDLTQQQRPGWFSRIMKFIWPF